MAINESSNETAVPAVGAAHEAQGDAVFGRSDAGRGVVGVSATGAGVWGSVRQGRGVVGLAEQGGDGVWGECGTGRGVVGVSRSGSGVWGHTVTGRAVVGVNDDQGVGVWGATLKGRGVVGVAQSEGDGCWGESPAGRGVVGVSRNGAGVWGHTAMGRAVVGVVDEEGAGVWGETKNGRGVVGISRNEVGVFGKGGRLAGLFEGAVEVTGPLRVQGLDVADLLRRFAAMEARLATLVAERAGWPTLTVEQLGRPDGGSCAVRVRGGGYRPFVWIKIRFDSAETGTQSPLVKPDHTGAIDANVQIRAFAGSVFTVQAVDDTAPQGEIHSETISFQVHG